MLVFQLLLCVFTLIKTQNTPLRIVTQAQSGALFVVLLSATKYFQSTLETKPKYSSIRQKHTNICKYLVKSMMYRFENTLDKT